MNFLYIFLTVYSTGSLLFFIRWMHQAVRNNRLPDNLKAIPITLFLFVTAVVWLPVAATIGAMKMWE